MVKLYADLCESGHRTCLDIEGVVKVPTLYLIRVIEELRLRGREDLIPIAQ